MNQKGFAFNKKLIFLLIIVLILVFGFGLFKPATIFSRTHTDASCGNNWYTQYYSLISQDDKSYTYQLIVLPNCVVNAMDGDVGMGGRVNFAFIINDLPSDIQKNKDFSGQIDFVGLEVAKYGGVQTPFMLSPDYWSISEKSVSCFAGEVSGQMVAQYGGSGMYSTYSGTGIQCSSELSLSTALTDKSYLSMGGVTKIIIDVTISKEGVECFDNSDCYPESFTLGKCGTFYTCSGGKCYKGSAACPPVDPPTPQPTGFIKLINSILVWLKDLFSRIFSTASIVGAQSVQPNTQHTYQIDLSAPAPDSDWTDGTYQIQYSNWALVDKDGNIKQEGTWEQVNGRYQKSVTITTPSNIGEYVLLAVITQYDMTFDSATGTWTTSEEKILNKEAIDLKTEYTVEKPSVPLPSGFSNFISSIINWIKSIWQSIFG